MVVYLHHTPTIDPTHTLLCWPYINVHLKKITLKIVHQPLTRLEVSRLLRMFILLPIQDSQLQPAVCLNLILKWNFSKY